MKSLTIIILTCITLCGNAKIYTPDFITFKITSFLVGEGQPKQHHLSTVNTDAQHQNTITVL